MDSTYTHSLEAVFLVALLASMVSSGYPIVTSQRSGLDELIEQSKILSSDRDSVETCSDKTIFTIFRGSGTHNDRIACSRDLICA